MKSRLGNVQQEATDKNVNTLELKIMFEFGAVFCFVLRL